MSKANSYSVTNSWLGYAASFPQAIGYGGGVTAFFGLIAAAAVQWVVLLGLAEMCSAFPSSGVSLIYLLLGPKDSY